MSVPTSPPRGMPSRRSWRSWLVAKWPAGSGGARLIDSLDDACSPWARPTKHVDRAQFLVLSTPIVDPRQKVVRDRAMASRFLQVAIVVLANVGMALKHLSPGAETCPCMNESSHDWTFSRRLLKEKANNSNYGMLGCDFYNADEFRDDEFPKSYNRAWCYVDIHKCKLVKKKCQKDPGSHNLYCRERPTTESVYVTNGSLRYSYETCGNLGSFEEGSRFGKWLSGFHIQAAIRPSEGLADPQQGLLEELAEKAVASLAQTKPIKDQRNLKAVPVLDKQFKGKMQWWTNQSKEMVQSMGNARDAMPDTSYSYCLHDVAIGNLDLCVVDTWVTPERASIVSFLPPIRFDHFFFVEKVDEFGCWAFLRPFTLGAWLEIIGVFGFAAALHLIDKRVRERASAAATTRDVTADHDDADRRVTDQVDRARQSFRDVGRQAAQLLIGDRAPNKWMTIGIAFYMLIVGTTYTAKLFEILGQRHSAGSIGGLEGVVDEVVCVDQLAWKQIVEDHPKVHFHPVPDSHNIPLLLRNETCKVAIMPEYLINLMHAGSLHHFVDENGRKDKGCNLQVTSPDAYLTFAVSFPVSNVLAHPLSWAMTKVLSESDVGIKLRQNLPPASGCGNDDGEQLGWGAMSGPLTLASLLMLFGFCLAHSWLIVVRR